jgi:hypothetical protein
MRLDSNIPSVEPLRIESRLFIKANKGQYFIEAAWDLEIGPDTIIKSRPTINDDTKYHRSQDAIYAESFLTALQALVERTSGFSERILILYCDYRPFHCAFSEMRLPEWRRQNFRKRAASWPEIDRVLTENNVRVEWHQPTNQSSDRIRSLQAPQAGFPVFVEQSAV